MSGISFDHEDVRGEYIDVRVDGNMTASVDVTNDEVIVRVHDPKDPTNAIVDKVFERGDDDE